MPAFSYTAIDADGRTRRGVVDAEAPRQARAGLRSAGLVPIEVSAVDSEVAAPGKRRLFWAARMRIGSGELSLLTRRFAMLLEAGLTVEQCLDALIEQAQGESARRILAAVRAEVLSGQSLAASFDPYPSSFPEIYRALVRAGEHSGELGAVMSNLAEYLERRQATRQSAGLALLYPAIVAAVALCIVVGLLTYVVPQVVDVFAQSRQELPFLTRALLWTSEALKGKLGYVAALLVVIALILRWAYSREATKRHWHARLLRLPLVGPLWRGIDTARLASSLAILSAGGVPLLQALAAGARVVKNLALRDAVEDAMQRVREGSTLHRALASRGVFPPIFIHLVASGEASGRLAHMLGQAGRQQEVENDARVRLLTGVLEPALILAMGALVLLIVLAILLPIIEMNQLVRI
ncbi:MAG TPA: type II secretion system inner membrane protein GspF [Burkholderiales bacterium]|jgi:general secretion pathway protein F|nr:type II secretion system inner membrane protein GspF [Burkholderiales bacterium]